MALGAAHAEPARENPTRFLRTQRLVIRPLEDHDRAEFVRVMRLSRDHLARHMPLHIAGEGDEALFARQIRQRQAGDATARDWRRVLFDTAGRMVGGLNFNDIRRGLENRAELTIWVAPEAAGRGHALEALAAGLGVAFAPAPVPGSNVRSLHASGLGLDRVSALVADDNTPCIRLLQRLGFNLLVDSPPLEITIGDRRVPHREWRLWARVAMLEAKPLHAFPARVESAIRQIEQVERSAEHRRF